MSPATTPAALAAVALIGSLVLPARAQPPVPDRQARAWAAACTGCHGTEGRGQGGIPALAGREADELLRALVEFRNGQRPAATVMHQHAKGYTEDELRRIAAWFAVQAAP